VLSVVGQLSDEPLPGRPALARSGITARVAALSGIATIVTVIVARGAEQVSHLWLLGGFGALLGLTAIGWWGSRRS
jgi:hypothetical protein